MIEIPNEINDPVVSKRALRYLTEFETTEKMPMRIGSPKLEKIYEALTGEDENVQIAFVLCVIDWLYLWDCVNNGNASEITEHLLEFQGKPCSISAKSSLKWFLRRKLPFEDSHFCYMVKRTAAMTGAVHTISFYLDSLIKRIENDARHRELSTELCNALGGLCEKLDASGFAIARRLCDKINRFPGNIARKVVIPGEAWADQALADLRRKQTEQADCWRALLEACELAKGSKPSAKWAQGALALVDSVGREEFKKHVLTWLPLVDRPRTRVIEQWSEYEPNPNLLICDINASILKGLVWCCSLFEDKEISRCLTGLAISAYKKVPGIGPRAVKIGNACIYSVGAMEGMEGVGQLALLKVKVRFRTALKLIDKALTSTAQRLGIERDELEEMSVPGYGLTDVGVLEEEMGSFTARLQVLGTTATELVWVKENGKTQKSVPAEVKRDFKDELKELKAAAKDIQKMLPAQRTRIENLYLRQKSWAYPVWKERYLDHSLVGTLGRRIIWKFRTGNKEADGIWLDGQIVDVHGKEVEGLCEDTQVSLWHPIANVADYVLAWRAFMVEHEIVQPFKQAHREIYVLTDAERATRIYSNRYAGHIVKQHQFNALCGVRGWHNTLKLMVDDEFPPASIALPKWKLRAEFWTDGAGDEYGEDTNETGTYYYLATDQVRFFGVDAARTRGHAFDRGQKATVDPVPLEEIPALVFSEVMRDIDLFVGVASVANDPTWNDGGPDGRYRDYWTNVSFGDLSATAQTRKEVLEGLIPRLKIAERCSIEGKFLKLRGDIRTYKIHLGSGNILMEPNDQYLCIVALRGAGRSGPAGKLFLPFEGDNTLSVILSKAFLLADDKKIKDPTIVQQIKR